MDYFWERGNWCDLHWQAGAVEPCLLALCQEQARYLQELSSQNGTVLRETFLTTLELDALKTSDIEGVRLDRGAVRAALERQVCDASELGAQQDPEVEGIVTVTVDAALRCDQPLTEDRLFSWHRSLFAKRRGYLDIVRVGAWRDDARGPMRIVSGAYGKERVHYVAPPAQEIPAMMETFLAWFNEQQDVAPPIKAALAHFWFVGIHPFEDGNGRTTRAISDMLLTRAFPRGKRCYSVSNQIRSDRDSYYKALEVAQRSDGDITQWLTWHLRCQSQAVSGAREMLPRIRHKLSFLQELDQQPLKPRQRKVLVRLLDGFQGKLTQAKWAKLAKCSPDEADEDIRDLVRRGLLSQAGHSSRGANYVVAVANIPEPPDGCRARL